ncbi:MAG: glutamate--cysteine ligase [Chloroflexia bacterium]
MSTHEEYTIGFEEEYQVIEPASRQLSQDAERLIARARETLGDSVLSELKLSQVEVVSPICGSLADVRREVGRLRQTMLQAAGAEGLAIASAGLHPFSGWRDQLITPKERYQDLLSEFRLLAREQMIYGCHVHIGLTDLAARVGVLNRVRPWLPVLLALNANSPYWGGEDSGFASYRTVMWSRWPVAGPSPHFESPADYSHQVRSLVSAGVVEDASKIYWDIRLPERYPTVEFRIADACTRADETVMFAGLCRGLVRACREAELRGDEYTPVAYSLLRAAMWGAARDGLCGELIDLDAARLVPASELVVRLLEYVRPSLESWCEYDATVESVERTLRDGTGAARQRAAHAHGGPEAVMDMLIAETAGFKQE